MNTVEILHYIKVKFYLVGDEISNGIANFIIRNHFTDIIINIARETI